MKNCRDKLERANVVAGFNNQDDAEEALLALRLSGFKDKRIGYFYPAGPGRMADLLARYHRFAATILWGGAGLAAGWGVGLLLERWFTQGLGPDPVGLAETCAIFGLLFFGTAGGMMGLWVVSPGTYARTSGGPTPPFLMAIDARDGRDRAWVILRRHGGFEHRPHGTSPLVHDDHLPGIQAA